MAKIYGYDLATQEDLHDSLEANDDFVYNLSQECGFNIYPIVEYHLPPLPKKVTKGGPEQPDNSDENIINAEDLAGEFKQNYDIDTPLYLTAQKSYCIYLPYNCWSNYRIYVHPMGMFKDTVDCNIVYGPIVEEQGHYTMGCIQLLDDDENFDPCNVYIEVRHMEE